MQKNLTKIFQERVSKSFILLATLSSVALLLISSCKDESSKVTTEYIDKIGHEAITLVDGSTISINPDDRIYYLVRHAEKDTIPKNDPDLTEQGYERSYELSKIFKAARVDEVYSTMYLRTLMTADSISKSKGMAMKTYDPKSLKEFAERLKNLDDQKRFLIVGHSNTTPSLANHIHGSTVLEDYSEKDYDNLVVVVQSKNEPSQIHNLKFKPQINIEK